MGSTDRAIITGFICRLCSKMNRFVIHIYGEEGEGMRLAEKINTYLPITININDPLPKTVCLHCIERLEIHHQLMGQILKARQNAEKARNPRLERTREEANNNNLDNPKPGTSSKPPE